MFAWARKVGSQAKGGQGASDDRTKFPVEGETAIRQPIEVGKGRKYDAGDEEAEERGVAGRKTMKVQKPIKGDKASTSEQDAAAETQSPAKIKDLERDAELNAILKRSPSKCPSYVQ